MIRRIIAIFFTLLVLGACIFGPYYLARAGTMPFDVSGHQQYSLPIIVLTWLVGVAVIFAAVFTLVVLMAMGALIYERHDHE